MAIIGDWSFIFMEPAWEWLEPRLLHYGLSWTAGHIVLLIWIGGVIALALGADAWLRRHGKPEPLDVPRCKCGYPVVGLGGSVCPECGIRVGQGR